MNIVDVLTLVLALWGAIISTVLGIRELKNEKRQIWTVIELEEFIGKYKVIITNIGYRPITISDVVVGWDPKKGENFYPKEIIPKFAMFDEQDKIPVTLEDGESVSLMVGPVLNEMAVKDNLRIKAIVYDAQGKVYRVNERRIFNARSNTYIPIKE